MTSSGTGAGGGGRSLLVEVQGTWLPNAGAGLMLRTVLDQLARRLPEASVVLDPRWGPYDRRAELGLRQVFPRTGVPGGQATEAVSAALLRVAPGRARAYLEGYGMVHRRDVGALLDVSGFALSDQWGPAKARERAALAEAYRRRGLPVLFLPQAFGPFADPDVAEAAARAVGAADRVWARDASSRASLDALVGGAAHVATAPDLTFASPPAAVDARAEVLLVPNGRMVDRGGWSPDAYVEVLVRAGTAAAAAGASVAVLLHTGEPEDAALGRRIAGQLGVEVVTEDDPLRLKGILAGARVVVASRFHAVVGALATGVVPVVIGWSHKYDELLGEVDQQDLLLDRRDAAARIAPLVAELLDGGAARRATVVTARVDELRGRLDALWDEVVAVLTTGGRAPEPRARIRPRRVR